MSSQLCLDYPNKRTCLLNAMEAYAYAVPEYNLTMVLIAPMGVIIAITLEEGGSELLYMMNVSSIQFRET